MILLETVPGTIYSVYSVQCIVYNVQCTIHCTVAGRIDVLIREQVVDAMKLESYELVQIKITTLRKSL